MRLPIPRRVARAYSFVRRRLRRLVAGPEGAPRVLREIIALAAKSADNRRLEYPLVAFITPVFDTPPRYLDELLASLTSQRPGSWELVLSDDGSRSDATRRWLEALPSLPNVKVIRQSENRGISAASNAAIQASAAPWIAFLDHDDALTPFALDRICQALSVNPRCQFMYTDEIICDEKLAPVDFHLKPAFDPVLLSGVNYTNHLSLYRRDRVIELGGLREGFQGSQDYDLVLRYTKGLKRDECLHLPFPAYRWRRHGASYSTRALDRATDNARRALGEAYATVFGPAPVSGAVSEDLHRIRFDVVRDGQSADWPLVSVIIPSRDAFELIERVLRGLTEGTDYPRLEIVVIDNGTTDPGVLDLYERYRKGKTPFAAFVEPEPFNFSRAINKGWRHARGDLLLLLNNDIEVLSPDWLKEMVSCFSYEDVGVVGAKLLYPSGTLQHAGVVVGFGGFAGHWFIEQPERFPGPWGRLWVRQSMSAVTGACMLVSRETFDRLEGLDEQKFAIAYNDVDLCMRAIASGKRVVWTPFARLTHHESASRGSDETAENIERFRREKENLRLRHATDRYEDFAINPWYSKDRSYPGPVSLPHLPEPR